jgi:hypothetical protein
MLPSQTRALVGNAPSTPVTGSFTASATTELLSIANPAPGQDITFIDNISVTGPSSVVPEPSTFMLAAALLTLGLAAHRRMER